MNRIEITSEIEVAEETIDKTELFCKKLLDLLKTDGWEVSILFCDNVYMRQLNKHYRGVDSPTDVLSFPQGEQYHEGETYYAGDISISIEECMIQAEEKGTAPDDELKRLIVHGLLHLKGMSHGSDQEYEEMIGLQERLVKQMSEAALF